jgi:2-methylisoborneol synthase
MSIDNQLAGPRGLGTAAARLAQTLRPAPPPPPEPEPEPAADRRPSQYIDGLYFHPPVRDDRQLADRINARLIDWFESEVRIDDDLLRDRVVAADYGRFAMLCHPDAVSEDHVFVAAVLIAAENVVDEFDCEEEHGGRPDGLGARLAVVQSAIDPTCTTDRYEEQWRRHLDARPGLRAMRSAFAHLHRIATPAQANRFRQDIASLYLGYNAEAADIVARRVPPVWEYLTQRQLNNFRPCLTVTDCIGGYVLDAETYALPEVQRATAYACSATTAVNDLYSTRREMKESRHHNNLPTVIAHEENCTIQEAFDKAVDVHNEIMHNFETLAARLAQTSPVLARYLSGLSNWLSGGHEWHAGLVGVRYATSP